MNIHVKECTKTVQLIYDNVHVIWLPLILYHKPGQYYHPAASSSHSNNQWHVQKQQWFAVSAMTTWSQSHTTNMQLLRIWPCITAWKIALILFCLKSLSISPFEVYASKVMLWYNFTVFDPSSSAVSYNITISVPRTLSIISVEWAQLWKHNSECMERWDLELWLLLGVVPLSQFQWDSYRSKSMM